MSLRHVRGELGAAVEDPPELAADDGRYGEQALERSVLAPRALEGLHLEVLVVDGDDQSGVELGERAQHRAEEGADQLVARRCRRRGAG